MATVLFFCYHASYLRLHTVLVVAATALKRCVDCTLLYPKGAFPAFENPKHQRHLRDSFFPCLASFQCVLNLCMNKKASTIHKNCILLLLAHRRYGLQATGQNRWQLPTRKGGNCRYTQVATNFFQPSSFQHLPLLSFFSDSYSSIFHTQLLVSIILETEVKLNT